MADLSNMTLSPDDQAALLAAYQAENEAYVSWRRAVDNKSKVEGQVRDNYLKQREAEHRAKG